MPDDDVVGSIERELARLRLPRDRDHAGVRLLDSHYALLGVLEEPGDPAAAYGHTVGGVAEALGVDRSTASRQVSSAARLGLLTSTTPESEQRYRVVEVTAAGRDQRRRARGRRAEMLRRVVDGWSEEDLVQLVRLARRLNAADASAS